MSDDSNSRRNRAPDSGPFSGFPNITTISHGGERRGSIGRRISAVWRRIVFRTVARLSVVLGTTQAARDTGSEDLRRKMRAWDTDTRFPKRRTRPMRVLSVNRWERGSATRYSASRARPLRRRRRSAARPPAVRDFRRNPCTRARFLFLG